jgi:hypothetical protein
MSSHTKTTRPRQGTFRVEQLEDRQLLSVTVTPPVLNLKSIEHGHGVFTVRIVSDTPDAKTLLQSPSTLTATLTEGGTTIDLGTALGSTNGPVHVLSQDFNGDGVNDLILQFRRSTLKDVTAGTATLTVSTSSTTITPAPSESTTVRIFSPGHGNNGHGHGHGNNGHGHGNQGEHGHGNNGHGHGHNGGNGHGHG